MDKRPAHCIPVQDTIIHVGRVTASFSPRSLFSKPLTIRKVRVRDGFFSLVAESHTTNVSRVLKGGGKDTGKDRSVPGIVIKSAKISNISYRMHNLRKSREGYPHTGMKWHDLDVKVLSAEGSDIRIHCGHMVEGELVGMTLDEKCGYHADCISGRMSMDKGRLSVSDFVLQDQWSDLRMSFYGMTFKDKHSFKHFLDEVSLEGVFSESILDMRTVAAFAPWTAKLKATLDIRQGQVKGPVNNMSFNSLTFKEKGGFHSRIDGRMQNITDFRNSSFSVSGSHFSFTGASAASFADGLGLHLPADKVDIPGNIRLDLSGGGPVDKLHVKASLTCANGQLRTDMLARNLLSGSPLMEGSIDSEDFDIRTTLRNTSLPGKCSMHGKVAAGLEKGNTSLEIDTLKISRLEVLGYDYSSIAAAGTLADGSFDGRIICSDPEMNFIFQGICNLSRKTNNALYKFYFNLGYADLRRTGIDRRAGKSRASGSVSANFMKTSGGDLIGDIEARNVILENDEGPGHIGDITVSSHSSRGRSMIDFKSGFATGHFTGNRFPRSASVITRPDADDRMSLTLDFSDSRNLLSFFRPGLYLSKGSHLQARLSGGELATQFDTRRIAISDNNAKDVRITSRYSADSSLTVISSGSIQAGRLSLERDSIAIGTRKDSADLFLTFYNSAQTNASLRLNAIMAKGDDGRISARGNLLESSLTTGGKHWQIDSCAFCYKDGGSSVKGLRIHTPTESAALAGTYDPTGKDSLSLALSNVDLSVLGDIIPTRLNGRLGGEVMLSTDENSSPIITSSLRCKGFGIDDAIVGDLMVGSRWNESSGTLDLFAKDSLGGKEPVSATARYTPSGKHLASKIALDSLDAGCLRNITGGIFSDMGGSLTGDISIIGPIQSLSIYSGNLRIDNGMLRIGFTNVPYNMEGPISVDDNGIRLDKLRIEDKDGAQGRIRGGVTWRKLKNVEMDTRIDFEKMEVLASSSSEGLPVYGNVNASGGWTLTGPLKSLEMGMNLTSTGYGDLHFQTKSSQHTASSDLLIFSNTAGEPDPYEEFLKSRQKVSAKGSGMTVTIKAAVNPEVSCSLELDRNYGNVLTGYGNGDIDIITGGNRLDISGDYRMTGGYVHFSAMGLMGRNFEIQTGSNIKFGGNILESTLDVNARYTTKASLSSIISDTTSTSTRRTVECGIHLSDKLRNPRFGFSVNVPDLDPTTASYVRSALSTEDKIQKQFLAILVANSFLPDDNTGGIVNNSDILYSNVTEMMSNQLNNIFTKLEIPVDLGFKYKPNEGGTDIFDVAVSTQLFNNRVSINGSVGNKRFTTAGNDVVGDLDIDIKLNRNGALRLRLFSHSADIYSNYLDNTQRNGAGLGYRREFNSLKELLRTLFHKKKKDDE